jgi:hypothetical protein
MRIESCQFGDTFPTTFREYAESSHNGIFWCGVSARTNASYAGQRATPSTSPRTVKVRTKPKNTLLLISKTLFLLHIQMYDVSMYIRKRRKKKLKHLLPRDATPALMKFLSFFFVCLSLSYRSALALKVKQSLPNQLTVAPYDPVPQDTSQNGAHCWHLSNRKLY